jgi:hypothetical protein
MIAPKLIVPIIAGGILLGAGMARYANPVMKFAERPTWLSATGSGYSTATMQFVDAGPEDLSPAWPAPGQVPYWVRTSETSAWRDPQPVAEPVEPVKPAWSEEADRASPGVKQTAPVLIEPVLIEPAAPALAGPAGNAARSADTASAGSGSDAIAALAVD